ncbi:MAG: bifunctional homocysteine S-methyltransferase/methylenetetrahydrofolate reductase [Oscillospiraceae bacterium]|nr:bifunctional homocysteine S-methyltransferase/methylenetetrahydrofolate reductase [Oscillospiraceae bacterium]
MLPNIRFFDGAFGTYYFDVSRDYQPCEMANVNQPHLVERIHREYIAAGVHAIKTNTYGANTTLLEDKAVRDQIIRAGYAIANRAVEGTDVHVFADIGWIGNEPSQAAEEYEEIVHLFAELGAKNFLFETFAEYEPVKGAIEWVKANVKDSCVILSFAASQDGYTKSGISYKNLIYQAQDDALADAVGLNCRCGPSHMLSLVKGLEMKKPLIVMPNSGYPSAIGGRMVFQNNSVYFAEKLADIYRAGAAIVGGCCGTTPEHIRMAITEINRRTAVSEQSLEESKNTGEKSAKAVSLKAIYPNRKIVAVELDPPIAPDCDFVVDAARKLSAAGADIITIADSPLAKSRADSIMTAAKIKRETGVDVLPHMACRDKNHIALKGMLLGAAFENIDKVLVVTGDPMMEDVHVNGKGVFSFNSYGLISYINSLNNEIFYNTPFLIGAALNVNARNFSVELERAQKKLERGATFLLTQPIFSEAAVENLKTARQKLDCVILAGILPVASYKNAVFLNNEVTGITIPDEVMNKLKDKSAEEVVEISSEYSLGIMKQLWDSCDGYYIMTPLKKVELICKLLKGLNDLNEADSI